MSEEQNPPTDLNSLPDQGDSVAAAKPFSIREYVFGCREKNISNNWPFSKKYMEMCLDRGVAASDVLPPFQGISIGKVDEVQHDLDYFVAEGNTEEASKSNAVRKGGKRRKGRGKKIKERLIVDLLDATPHSTKEEIGRIYKDWYSLPAANDDDDQTVVDEGSSHQEFVTSRNVSTPEVEPASEDD